MTEPELVDLLAERHHARTSDIPWAYLAERDRNASRAAVGAVVADLRAIAGGCGDE